MTAQKTANLSGPNVRKTIPYNLVTWCRNQALPSITSVQFMVLGIAAKKDAAHTPYLIQCPVSSWQNSSYHLHGGPTKTTQSNVLFKLTSGEALNCAAFSLTTCSSHPVLAAVVAAACTPAGWVGGLAGRGGFVGGPPGISVCEAGLLWPIWMQHHGG